jgi:oligoendopeptidase F
MIIGENMQNQDKIRWDNSLIYQNFSDPKLVEDLNKLKSAIESLKKESREFEDKTAYEKDSLPKVINIYRKILDLEIMIRTIQTYAQSAVSVNALNYEAKNIQAKADQISSHLTMTAKASQLYLRLAPQDYLESFLKDPKVSELSFYLRHLRKENDFLLSVKEEVILERHSLEGLKSWGKLYSDIAGSLKIDLKAEKISLPKATNLLMQADRTLREEAYRGINKAWENHEISACAILNSINGWRLENNRARSSMRELHYLDKSCHQSRISRETLGTLMETTFEGRALGQKALKLMAEEMKVPKLSPWDILAPNPSSPKNKSLTFSEGMKIIIDSFSEFSSDMANFAQMMVDKNWIDCSPSENRAQGAYCTSFVNVREPRVFMTYEGSLTNVITLAHELGHAYHNWVLRDLPLVKASYPMTLAETASIFAETLVRENLLKNAKTKEEQKEILWQELISAASFLINIPARFEFERKMVELKKDKTVTVPELKKLTRDAWALWYEDSLSEYNEMFWASKLHFSIPTFGFYNYPYLFGYLFSLGIYAKKDELGSDFENKYREILLDTGVMSAEDLINKHFNQDIRKKDFWKNSLSIVSQSIKKFENL